MTYYPDSRITYDKAAELVEKYITDKTKTRRFITATEVLRGCGLENTEHNRKRVHHALQGRYDVAEDVSGRRKRYEVR